MGNNSNIINNIKGKNNNNYTRMEPITEEEYQLLMHNDISGSKKSKIIKRLLDYLIREDEKSKEYASNYYYYLLNRDGSYDEEEIDFITRYTIYLNYHRIKYDEEGKVKPGYEYIGMPKIMVIDKIGESEETQTLAGYAMNAVIISRDFSITPWRDGDKEKLFGYIQALSHEMVHYKQDYEAKNGMLTMSSFKEIIWMATTKQPFDDEHNYRFREIEVEAQIESMLYAVEIGRQYLPREVTAHEAMLQNREQYLMEEAFSFQQDDENTVALRDFYDIGLLSIAVANGIEILGNKIDLLDRYPQLCAFFNENRQMRSEEELLMAYQYLLKDNNELANIYEQFLVYIYHKEDIIGNKNLPTQLIEVKKMFIIRQVRKELKSLDIIHQLEKEGKSIGRLEKWGLDIEKIIRLRKERLELYYQFLSSLQSYEKETCEIIKGAIKEYEIVLDKIGSKKELQDIIYNTIDKGPDDNNNNNKVGY